jgi:hypothetical protein
VLGPAVEIVRAGVRGDLRGGVVGEAENQVVRRAGAGGDGAAVAKRPERGRRRLSRSR